MMEELPQHVVLEILSRLPKQELLGCRCVCKTWCALIKISDLVDDDLLVVHSRQSSPKRHVVSCYKYDCDSPSSVRAQLDINTNWAINTSTHCKGLICLSSTYTDILINPALRETKILPRIPSHSHSPYGFIVYAAIGLGFDDAKRDYKVVRLFRIAPDIIKGPIHWEGFIYNLKTNSWRKLEDKLTFSPENIICSSPSLFFKGLVHWAVRVKQHCWVLTFNMTTELFGEMQLPPSVTDFSPRLFVLDKSIICCVSCVYRVHVWVMEEYGKGESWTKRYSVPRYPICSTPVALWKNDKLILDTRDGELICYDLPTGQLHRLQQDDPSNILWVWPFPVRNQSLVSINKTVDDPPFASWEVFETLFNLMRKFCNVVSSIFSR